MKERFFYFLDNKTGRKFDFDKKCNFVNYDNDKFIVFAHKESDFVPDEETKEMKEVVKDFAILAMIPYSQIHAILSAEL